MLGPPTQAQRHLLLASCARRSRVPASSRPRARSSRYLWDTLASHRRRSEATRGEAPRLAAPELGCCASSGRAWWLWAARRSQGDRPRHWPPSHCLECRSQPPLQSPTPPPVERAGPLGGQCAGGGEAGCPQAQGRLGRRPGSLPQVRRVGGAPPLPAAVGLKGVVAEGAQSNCGCRGVPRRTVGCPSRPGPLRIYSQRNQANGWFHDWFTRDSSLW